MKKFKAFAAALILAASPVSVSLNSENIVCAAASSVSSATLDGEVSYNILENEYSRYYATVVNSYLFENSDGTFTRVENINKNIVVTQVTEKRFLLRVLILNLNYLAGFLKVNMQIILSLVSRIRSMMILLR